MRHERAIVCTHRPIPADDWADAETPAGRALRLQRRAQRQRVRRRCSSIQLRRPLLQSRRLCVLQLHVCLLLHSHVSEVALSPPWGRATWARPDFDAAVAADRGDWRRKQPQPRCGRWQRSVIRARALSAIRLVFVSLRVERGDSVAATAAEWRAGGRGNSHRDGQRGSGGSLKVFEFSSSSNSSVCGAHSTRLRVND